MQVIKILLQNIINGHRVLDGVVPCNVGHFKVKFIQSSSILGPFLFLVYINDLPNPIKQCRGSLFANDTTLVSAGNKLDVIKQELFTFIDWFKWNKISVNYSKCVLFGKNCLCIKITRARNSYRSEMQLPWSLTREKTRVQKTHSVYNEEIEQILWHFIPSEEPFYN